MQYSLFLKIILLPVLLILIEFCADSNDPTIKVNRVIFPVPHFLLHLNYMIFSHIISKINNVS